MISSEVERPSFAEGIPENDLSEMIALSETLRALRQKLFVPTMNAKEQIDKVKNQLLLQVTKRQKIEASTVEEQFKTIEDAIQDEMKGFQAAVDNLTKKLEAL